MSARATATSPAEARREGSRRSQRLRWSPRTSIILLVLFAGAVFAVSPARAYLDQREERERLAEQVALLEEQNARLQQRLDQLNQPAELERLARECLGMVRPGEIAFVPIRPGEAPTPPDCE